jgi:hypothetical protein
MCVPCHHIYQQIVEVLYDFYFQISLCFIFQQVNWNIGLQVERDTLRIKLDQLRSGKTFEELDQGLDVQVHHFSLKLCTIRHRETHTEFDSISVALEMYLLKPLSSLLWFGDPDG